MGKEPSILVVRNLQGNTSHYAYIHNGSKYAKWEVGYKSRKIFLESWAPLVSSTSWKKTPTQDIKSFDDSRYHYECMNIDTVMVVKPKYASFVFYIIQMSGSEFWSFFCHVLRTMPKKLVKERKYTEKQVFNAAFKLMPLYEIGEIMNKVV